MRTRTVSLFLFCLILGWAESVSAATLYIDPGTATLNRGDAITVAVRLDTDEVSGECVNAVDAVIAYPDSITPVDISIGKSIFSLWVQMPTINKDSRTITFAGGMPNGYCGRVQGDPNLTNTLTELVFRTTDVSVTDNGQSETAHIFFDPATMVYLNDGTGTHFNPRTIGTTLTINNTVGELIKNDWKGVVESDTIVPEAFSILLQREDKTFNGNYFIAFNTTDKQSGLSHYEVIEESTTESKLFRFGAATSPWIETPSPYELHDQKLRSVIRVKAIDKAGNEYIATLIPDESLRAPFLSMTHAVFMLVALMSIIAAILICVIQIRKRKPAIITASHDGIE